MGEMINGQWHTTPIAKTNKSGHFVRPQSVFRHRIGQDSRFTPEPNRYHLYVSYACPWASRTIIFRALKNLESVISLSSVEPLMLENGWEFGSSSHQDPLYNFNYLYQIYQKADPHYSGKVTVPVLWDKKEETIVNNESGEIIRMLNSEFNAYTDNKYDFYPPKLQKEIEAMNDFIYENINNGVYRCGFAQSQEAYELAFDPLFSALDKVEETLSRKNFLIGSEITEADWRLFTTLIRFDVVYYSHFKCNLKQMIDYPNLWNYLLRLYQVPGIDKTVNFADIKQHYYGSHKMLNPSGIIPKGPQIDFNQASHR